MLSGAGSIMSWSGRAGTLDFELSQNGVNGNYFDLLTYCGDPFRTLSVGPVGGAGFPFAIVSLQTYGYSSGDIVLIEKLWALAFSDSTTSATKAAAFQFLLWEIIADSSVDFSAGLVRISNAAVLNQATAWNSQLASATERATLLVLDGRAENRQSFFFEQEGEFTSDTPEPATMALMGAGLVAVVLVRRRR